MSIAAIQSDSLTPLTVADSAIALPHRDFESEFRFLLDRAKEEEGQWNEPGFTPDQSAEVEQRLVEAGHEETVRKAGEAAAKLVASTFIIPLLAAMRESPFQTERFGPTMAERRMGPVLDQQIADRIVQRSDFPIVEAVKNSILSKQAQRLGLTGAPAGRSIDATG